MSPDAEDVSPSPEPGFDPENSGIMAEEKAERASTEENSPSQTGNGDSKPAAKSNAKDPSRPRRKKARRACFACQRAHLTCGDERPCLRCIKRGLQDQCHDGVRKKAKYLHDAPAEALMPGFPAHYQINGSQPVPAMSSSTPIGPNGIPIAQPNYMPQQPPPGNFPQYGSVSQPGRMGPPMIEDTDPMLAQYASQSNVDSPPQYQANSSQQVSPVQAMTANLDQNSGIENPGNQSFDSSYIEANDPSLFNFDLAGLNFGNHYGALEFGMLGHMSSGAVGTPEVDAINQLGGQPHHGNLSYDGGFNPANSFSFNHYPGWQGAPNAPSRQSSSSNVWTTQNNGGLDAFAIGENSHIGQSPHSGNYDFSTGYQSASPEAQFAQIDQNQQNDLLRQSISQASQQHRKQIPSYTDPSQRRRRRDTSEIYNSVNAPYPYTQGFHALTAFLQKRFPSKKTLRIAKALASVRPSFITCNKNLNYDDLIFMEKSLQRMLYEYEDFTNHYGTPTVICRRTGEIAAVSKEFSLVTGWRRDVLLGKEPNLNVNTGSNASMSGTHTGASTRGAATPRMPNVEIDPGRPQPVFLAELMDEDSVVQFYEDFAELAFGEPRGSIIGLSCSLLKYKTKQDPGWGSDDTSEDDNRLKRISSSDIKQESIIKGRDGMNALGERDGRVECAMCWTVKRDVFDIPMMIVMNFLPII